VSGKARCSPNAHTSATTVLRAVAEERNMRRLGLAVVVAAMMLVSGCGRQVTGLNSPNQGIVPPGQALIRFETSATPDYANFTYLIVLNTTGNLNEPYAIGYSSSNYANWSMIFIVGGGTGFAQAPILRQVYQDPVTGSIQPFTITYPQGSVNFQPTLTGGNTRNGFQITFNRCILDRPAPTGTPPSTSICPPYTFIKPQWAVNLFTLDNTNSVIDSLGPFVNDTSVRFNFDTGMIINDQTYFKPATNTQLSNPSAQITGIEVFNTP
jgi:hypothetical protein